MSVTSADALAPVLRDLVLRGGGRKMEEAVGSHLWSQRWVKPRMFREELLRPKIQRKSTRHGWFQIWFYNCYSISLYFGVYYIYIYTLQGTSISPQNGIFEDYFPFPHPWRVYNITYISIDSMLSLFFVWISWKLLPGLEALAAATLPLSHGAKGAGAGAFWGDLPFEVWWQISWFDPEIYMIWVYMYIYIYLYIYTEREREKEIKLRIIEYCNYMSFP